MHFEWSEEKNKQNIEKHGISFCEAQEVFLDCHRIVYKDLKHSQEEKRYLCLGMIDKGVVTVRFTYRNDIIRIIGAGHWRKGKKIYERLYRRRNRQNKNS